MKTLDKTRPYGEICGYVEDGSKYEQDGCLFRVDGTMIEKNKEEQVIIEPEIPELEQPTTIKKRGRPPGSTRINDELSRTVPESQT